MHKTLQTGLSWVTALGVDPVKSLRALRNVPVTIREHLALRRDNAKQSQPWRIDLASPNFTDRDEPGGITSGHYFHQDLLVARRIYSRNPKKHVDIGSRIDGFVAHVAVFREIEVFDIRPAPARVENVVFRQRDITSDDDELIDYCDSISSLHALEHFGLGRYGDPLDVNGYEKGFAKIARMLESRGLLYLSFPIGEERIEFNGQRVFSLQRAFELFADDFDLDGFSYIDDAGDLHESVELSDDDITNNLGLMYGCAIFELRKK